MDLPLNLLNNGVKIPWIGLGVFKMQDNGEVERAVSTALSNGYRMVDTAYVYHNEEGVGRGIKKSGIPREELFLSTKVGNNQQGYESTKKAFFESLKALQTDYLDLYLIHWPQGKKSLESWKAMQELYEEGLVRAIGVSNFHIHHLDYLITNSRIKPAVNQVEFHPRHNLSDLYIYCKNKNIKLIAWSPLMQGKVFNIPEIHKIAGKYNKTPAQIVLRWNIQKGVTTIPKSSKSDRLVENIGIFDFTLDDEDMKKIDHLNRFESLIQNRDRIIHLLEMLSKQKFSKTIYRLLFKTVFDKISPRKEFS
jgi:methylglyoxal/glyoxal reductase